MSFVLIFAAALGLIPVVALLVSAGCPEERPPAAPGTEPLTLILSPDAAATVHPQRSSWVITTPSGVTLNPIPFPSTGPAFHHEFHPAPEHFPASPDRNRRWRIRCSVSFDAGTLLNQTRVGSHEFDWGANQPRTDGFLLTFTEVETGGTVPGSPQRDWRVI
jgi:hypothetical protein